MQPGEKRLLLQSQQPDIESALRSFPEKLAEQVDWETSIVGSGQSREQVVLQLERTYRILKTNGCSSLDIPNAAPCDNTGECKQKTPPNAYYAGYTVIQNTSKGLRPPSNDCPAGVPAPCPVLGQSVILVAPIVGWQGGIWYDSLQSQRAGHLVKCYDPSHITCKHQAGYSDILNNGKTNNGYTMQVGLYFANATKINEVNGDKGVLSADDRDCKALSGCNGEGLVVWTGFLKNDPDQQARSLFSTESPTAQAMTVPYITGHDYYTTITYSGGAWWTCAADMANPATYECQNHNARPKLRGTPDLGNQLVEDLATSLFVESWDEGVGWADAFTLQWPAHDARIYYRDGQPQLWSSQAVYTIDACPDPYPATNGVVGSLVPLGWQFNNGWAFFNAANYDPPFCYSY